MRKTVNPKLSAGHPPVGVVAVTGGVGCGKSSVMRLLGAAGWPLLSADEIAREVVAPGSPALEAIIQHFGGEYLQGDGTLNRKLLAERIFASPSERKELEAILHPRIRSEARAKIQALQKDLEKSDRVKTIAIAYEIPLFFEAGYHLERQRQKVPSTPQNESTTSGYPEISFVLVVTSKRELARERLMKREGMTYDEAERRIAAQMELEEKCRLADYVIENNGSEEDLSDAVKRFLVFYSTHLAE